MLNFYESFFTLIYISFLSCNESSSLRYGDITIFKMAAVRHLGIVLPQYETTHEVSVAGRSCVSNFMSIWCTDLKIQRFEFFAYLAWNAYSGPKMGFLGDFGPINVIIHTLCLKKPDHCDYHTTSPIHHIYWLLLLERDLIQFSIDMIKSFLNWLRTNCVFFVTTRHTRTANFWADFEQRITVVIS